MEHIVRFRQGFDCIRFECISGQKTCKPGSGGSHGKHGLEIIFISKGLEGAVQFVLYTGWLPQKTEISDIGYRSVERWSDFPSSPSDLGYHSKAPRYEGQETISDSCEWCDGKPCFYDGSSLNSTDAMYALVNGGDNALWSFLDGYYDYVFSGKEYPRPSEYPRKARWEEEE